jgi:putative membrane protein
VTDLLLVAFMCACSLAGALAGFSAGLVPGLHMNNIAAGITAYSGAIIGAIGLLSGLLGFGGPALLITSFISGALVGHMFAEGITSTYLGIPSEDVVSVLPAHRLARAGLGEAAVRASADGTLFGIVVSVVLLLPTCLLMGEPVGLYRLLSKVMGFIIAGFSVVLIFSEGQGRLGRKRLASSFRAAALFLASGVMGTVVLCTDYSSCNIPDLLLSGRGFVFRSSLLLPMFAGLFGIPGLILGLSSSQVTDCPASSERSHSHSPSSKDVAVSVLGGILVGWMPGMTSGSAATVCAPSVREHSHGADVRSSARFIWLYSAISGAGAVFAVGALFIISRARSGSMDAAQFFLGDAVQPGALLHDIVPMAAMVLSMVFAAFVGHLIVSSLNSRLHRLRPVLCSAKVAMVSLVFVSLLSFSLTGSRGVLVMATACCLGLLAPLAHVRRIQLMGCLLVPIMLGFFGLA